MDDLDLYIEYILSKASEVNVISKKIDKPGLQQLIEDTLSLEPLIKQEMVIDVGSGNGIIGVPIAIKNKTKRIMLIEPRIKKANFLRKMVEDLKIDNINVFHQDIQTYIKTENSPYTIISRGFPEIEILYKKFVRHGMKQLIIISSKEKFKKIRIEKFHHTIKTYDIKNRDLIKIFVLESVSRETL